MSTPGQAVGGLVGAVAGFFLGGGPMGAVYGAQAGMMLGGMLDPPKGPTVDGPGLDDLTVQTSTYGAVIPRIYGTVAVNGNLFWLENNALKQTVTKKKSGGKGGGSTTTTRVKTYSATFSVGLCKGPIVGVRRIWIRGGMYYDAGSSDPGTIQASNAAAAGFAVYLGTDTQSPDARMQATLGAGNTPAWRGLAYIVFYDLQLEKYGNSLMGAQVRVEVCQAGFLYQYVAQPGVQTSTTGYWSAVAWNGSVLCSVKESSVVSRTSTNGLNWVERSNLPSSLQWACVERLGTMLLAFAKSSNTYCTSVDDGISWTQRTYNSGYSMANCYAASSSSRLVLTSASYNEIFVTTDGINWSRTTFPGAPFGGSPVRVTFSESLSKFIMGYTKASNNVSYFAKSSDGINWVTTIVPFTTVPDSFSVCDAKGMIVIASGSTNRGGFVSTDGGSSFIASTGIANGSALNGLISDGQIFFGSTSNGYSLSYDAFSWTNYSVPTLSTGFSEAVWTGAFFSMVNLGSNARDSAKIVPQFLSTETVSLSSIVSPECLQSGLLTAGDIEVADLTPSVRGYAVGSVGAIRAALEPLQAAWPFDARQHGYKIQFVMRGGSSVVTIPAADLDARDAGADPGVQITTAREMDSQLPKRVTVNYLDADREYNRGTQYAERLTTPSINALTLDLPIVLTSTEGAGKAEVLLYLYWLERHDVSITLPPTYNQLEAGDVVTLATPEGNVTLRLTAVNYTSTGRVECKAKYANAAIYTPTAVASSPAVTGPTTITPVGASVYALLDVPQISTAQSSPSFLAAMTGALAGWDGGVLMQSTDAGASWAQLQAFDSPGSTLGTASNSIGAVDSRVIDSGSVLNVTLTQGALYSITQLAMFAGKNLFAYGADGRWEIIAAQTCTLVSGTSYALRDLMRGRFGTEWAMSLHTTGDTIVLLDTTDVALIAMGSGTIGLSFLYRGITVDRDISTDSNRSFAYRGVNLKPLSPIALAGARDPSSNDWSLTWIRRTREGGEWRDYVDASLGETSQVYQIDVFADGTYTTIKRTITTSTPDASYSSADQVTDFGANQSTLYLKIYQLSSVVGRGYPLTQSLTG